MNNVPTSTNYSICRIRKLIELHAINTQISEMLKFNLKFHHLLKNISYTVN